MSKIYTTYEAKARFSEILRRVRDGQSVTISYHGTAVAEIRPVYATGDEDRALQEMEDEGILSRSTAPTGELSALAKKKGALKRFLDSRE
ncbi:MAG: type II toxin-antitoxin system prevent-host-death family antitoxin [bacterium]|nr:type II toxin-antitoxin system prevent-host-death family antitoxin [bacterium]